MSKTTKKEVITKPVVDSISLYDKIEAHIASKKWIYTIGITLIATFISYLLFKARVLNNDDALYIQNGASYANNFFGFYHTENAPFYPMFLSFFIKIFGVDIIKLKLISVLSFVASIFILIKAFETRIPYIVALPAIFLTAINATFASYASLTFTEAFYSLFQALFIWATFVLVERVEKESDWKKNLPLWIVYGLLLFLMYFTRTVAIAGLVTIVAFFVLQKKYIHAVLGLISFALFYVLNKISLKVLWSKITNFGDQSKILFQKDAYKPELGNEDAAGFVARFFENSHIYLSSRFTNLMGMNTDSINPETFAGEPNKLITLLIAAMLGYVFYRAWKNKDKYIMLSLLYTGAMCAITFITLQTQWGQERLIMVLIPFLLIGIFYFFYDLFKNKVNLPIVYIAIIVVFTLTSLSKTNTAISENSEELSHIRSGDLLFGYETDFQNYINMSRYCSDSLPKGSFVAVRKPTMSFIFANGKNFYGIYRGGDNVEPDTLVKQLRDAKVTHIALAELRLEEKVYRPNEFMSTVHRFAGYIQKKYPGCFKMVKVFGTEEPATLLEIDYAYIDSMRANKNTLPSQPQ
jgi:hypothetical protein